MPQEPHLVTDGPPVLLLHDGHITKEGLKYADYLNRLRIPLDEIAKRFGFETADQFFEAL